MNGWAADVHAAENSNYPNRLTIRVPDIRPLQLFPGLHTYTVVLARMGLRVKRPESKTPNGTRQAITLSILARPRKPHRLVNELAPFPGEWRGTPELRFRYRSVQARRTAGCHRVGCG